MFGADRVLSGEIALNGKGRQNLVPHRRDPARRRVPVRGPEAVGLFLNMTVQDNILFSFFPAS